MARIRTIKPSFFKNEELSGLSFAHRLCFIGLWGQADREGRLEDRPRRLKAEIFPYDDVDVDALLSGLAEKGFVLRYDADGVPAIQVAHFLKHQRPKSDEAHSEIRPPPFGAVPLGDETAPRIGKERSTGKEEEGKGSEGADAAPSPAHLFGVAWNELTSAPIAKVQQITSKRRRHIHARLEELPLTEWRLVFARIEASSFCRGQNDRGWTASFDWVIGSADVAVKVLEGKYDDRKSAAAQTRAGPVPVETWTQECKRIHNGECGLDRWRHCTRKDMEAAKAAG